MLLLGALVAFVSSVGAHHEVKAEGSGLNDYTQSFHWVGHDEIRAYMAAHHVDRMGYEGSNDLFICKSLYKGHTYPGKFYFENGTAQHCQFAADGKEHMASVYQVLDTRNEVVKFIIRSVDNLPKCAFSVGTDATINQPHYVCRVRHHGKLILGRAVKKDGNCYVPYFGEELGFSKYYEIAVEKSCAESVGADDGGGSLDDDDDDDDGGLPIIRLGYQGSIILKIVLSIVGIILACGCCFFCFNRISCSFSICQC